MANVLLFDSSLPETFLEVNGKLSGFKASLNGHATTENLPDLEILKASYVPSLDVSRIIWPKVLSPSETTVVFWILGADKVKRLAISRSIDIFQSSSLSLDDSSLWDAKLLVKLIDPSWLWIENIQSLDQVFARNEMSRPIAEQCQVAIRNIVTEWLYASNYQYLSKCFSDWVDNNPDRFNCAWYQEIAAERRRQEAAEKARKAAEEEAKKKARQQQIAYRNPKAILKLAPDCPDWMVQIYWKALMKAVAPRELDDPHWEWKNKLTKSANAAFDKIKAERGDNWNPKQLPWEK